MSVNFLKFMQNVPKCILGIFLCLTTLAVFIPFNPKLPGSGLDESWMFAMNQAVAQGLVFGKDIIFPLGPYASIYSKEYHPATDQLMVWGSFFLGACYSISLILLASGRRFHWLLVNGIFLASLTYPLDPLFFSYPLILGLVTYRITLPNDHASKLNMSKLMTVGFAILFLPLGLLPLIKGSLLLISGSITVFCFTLFWRSKQKLLAYSSVILPLISGVLFWALTGQPIFALPIFFIKMSLIISGYTEAMAITGNAKEIILYILASVLIVYDATSNKIDPIISRIFLFLSYAVFLFIAFKEGFVRHDGHAIMAGTSIVIAGLSTALVIKERSSVIVLLVSVLAWGYIDKGYYNSSTGLIYNNIRNTYSNAWDGLRLRLSGTNKLKENFDNSISTIKKAFLIPPLHGTTDIYSYNQSYLLASTNKWSPRPIFQSYSAYTPSLARLNEKHLRSDSAPDNIVFKVEPIDGRLPALEDGLSWPALINNYSVQKLGNHFVYLQKRAEINKDRPAVEFYHSEQNLGEEVILPETNIIKGSLFAKIEISPTLLGRVRSILFKPPQLNISVKLIDGRTKNFRIIANMASAGFLISPLVENTEDFVFLTVNQKDYLTNNVVKSFTISSSDGEAVYWRKSFFAHLQKLDLLRHTDIFKLNPVDEIINGPPNGMSEFRSTICDGFIDVVNGISPAPASLTFSKTLSVDGWMAISAKDGIVPDAVFVTLSDENGKKIYIKARRTPRLDVKEYFKQPRMPDPGYTAFIDVSTLSGKYTLGLSRVYKGTLESCQQFSLPLFIKR